LGWGAARPERAAVAAGFGAARRRTRPPPLAGTVGGAVSNSASWQVSKLASEQVSKLTAAVPPLRPQQPSSAPAASARKRALGGGGAARRHRRRIGAGHRPPTEPATGNGGNAVSTPWLTGGIKITRPARRRDLRLAAISCIVPVEVPKASFTLAKVP
jgi:hypothetical protein